MEEKFDSKHHSKIKIIGINQTIVLKEVLINLMNKQVMKKYPNHDYKVSQSLGCGLDKFVMS
jgi:hypothetical protein